MSNLLEVSGLCKQYPEFSLKEVSFSVPRGSITGFIGRNGAGKTTTLKSILNLVHPEAGEISYFGLQLSENEVEIKQRIGYAGGTVNYYKKKKLRDIVAVTSSFYRNWNENARKKDFDLFALDENKTPEMLSEGMKVKFNLALSLSHNAEFLILDEPTSGLDPVSREELLEIFLALRSEGISILFSTHITSDLDRSADRIIYIRNGQIISEDTTASFEDSYRVIRLPDNYANAEIVLGKCRTKNGQTGLIRKENSGLFDETSISIPTLEEIMVHMEKGEKI